MYSEIAPNLSPENRKLVISLFLERLDDLGEMDFNPKDSRSARLLQMRFHRYSGSAFMIGANNLGTLLKELELQLETGQSEEYHKRLGELPAVLGEARAMAQHSLRNLLRQ